MLSWLRSVDQILRGETTRMASLREGMRFPVAGVAAVTVVLGLVYGFCMGCFAMINRQPPVYEQLVASTIKVPLLFVLTLIVTFPSLYVFNALVGSRLTFTALLRLLLAAMAVTLAVLASFGPITIFFSVSTDSYSFMVLLNVALYAVAGFLGLAFLLQTLHRLSVPAVIGETEPPAGPSAAAPPVPHAPAPSAPQVTGGGPVAAGGGPVSDRSSPGDGALDDVLNGREKGPHVRAVFRCWIVIFALVGGQMSWVLRPFIGNPGQPFTWFRERQSNFFEAVLRHLASLFQ